MNVSKSDHYRDHHYSVKFYSEDMSLLNGSTIFAVFFVLSSVIAIGDGHGVLEAPYQALIRTYKDTLHIGTYSGAVLSPLFVITTKSAVVNGTSYLIKLSHATYAAPGTSMICQRHSTNIPPFFPPTDHIALLQMKEEIAFTLHVQPVTLPLPYNGGDNSSVPNYVAQVTGFTPDMRIRFSNVEVTSPSSCSKQWPEYQNWNTTLCTGSIFSDDFPYGYLSNGTGAPLVAVANRTLVGIFDNSTVARSQELNGQYLFIKIEPYVDWIRTVVDLIQIDNYHDDETNVRRNRCWSPISDSKMSP